MKNISYLACRLYIVEQHREGGAVSKCQFTSLLQIQIKMHRQTQIQIQAEILKCRAAQGRGCSIKMSVYIFPKLHKQIQIQKRTRIQIQAETLICGAARGEGVQYLCVSLQLP